MADRPTVAIIGGGFTGLAAAYELALRGARPIVIEEDVELGGLAGSFPTRGQRLEKFYHHWFTSDRYIMDLVDELGVSDRVDFQPTRTGMYYANRTFRLSSPLDVLRFTPLSLRDRLRLGLLVLRARRVADWQRLECQTAAEWLTQMSGPRVYRTVWEPLLRGKFGDHADDVSAVWIWNKLKLRGGSRGRRGAEVLAYYRGGFAALADSMAAAVRRRGGELVTGTPVTQLLTDDECIVGVIAGDRRVAADAVLATTPLPIFADLVADHAPAAYVDSLRRIDYLGNICLVLELDRSISSTYWLNVNDPSFPFVGIIEHTNFESPEQYGGRHIVYLSKYLPRGDTLWRFDANELLEYSLPHIKRMFPQFQRSWIHDHHLWKADYAQPIVVRHYSRLIPATTTPLQGLYLSTMAQIYPEDRGTNYAVRDGRRIAGVIAADLVADGRAAGPAAERTTG